MIGIQSVAASMAELCSSMPTSGGLYYASAVLAPPGWGPLAAWITGWSNWLGQITGAPSVNYGTAAMTLAAASIAYPSYTPQNYQVYLLTVLLMVIHACMASLPTKTIARVNSFGSSFNIVALIVVLILIPAGTNREEKDLPRFTPSKEVWGDIYQGTDFPSGVSILMSFIGVIWTMSGYVLLSFHLEAVFLKLMEIWFADVTKATTHPSISQKNAVMPPSHLLERSSSPQPSAALLAGSFNSSSHTPSSRSQTPYPQI